MTWIAHVALILLLTATGPDSLLIAVADLIPLGSDKCKAPRVVRACVEVDLDMRPFQAN